MGLPRRIPNVGNTLSPINSRTNTLVNTTTDQALSNSQGSESAARPIPRCTSLRISSGWGLQCRCKASNPVIRPQKELTSSAEDAIGFTMTGRNCLHWQERSGSRLGPQAAWCDPRDMSANVVLCRPGYAIDTMRLREVWNRDA